jgi:mercuric reductase
MPVGGARARGGDPDLLVIGGGSAGFAAAIRGAELGARVALVSGGVLGGTCVNVGCIPSKTLIRAGEVHHRRSHHAFAGVPRTDGVPSWPMIRHQKDELVATLQKAKYRGVLASHETVRLYEASATVTSGNTVRLSTGGTLRAERLILATGSSPWFPPVPGLAESGALDSADAMALERLPARLLVIGASAVGLELGQLFSRLGVSVTIVEAQPGILPLEDPEIGEALAAYLAAEGIAIHTGVRLRRVERRGAARRLSFEGSLGEALALEADEILVAAGRRPNSHRLGLEAVGVERGPKGEVLVDRWLRTDAGSIYAAGDVLGDPMFVYVAARAGATAAVNALQGDVEPYDLATVPRVVFTDPAVAAVGLSAQHPAASGTAPRVATLQLEQVPRALAARDTRGFIKLVADPGSRRLLGAHILAAEAGEMIMEAALAIRAGLTIDDLAATLHPYLTLAEGLKLAAQSFDRDVAALSCCAA